MKKALIYLSEDLSSSMAFRFAAVHTRQLGMALQAIHVVEADAKSQEETGWVRRSWEKLLIAEGLDEVSRLVKTENIDYVNAGETKIALGNKDTETLNEVNSGAYSLYFEGFVTKRNNREFLEFLDAKRFQEINCPVVLVKNLVDHENLLLLLDDKTDTEMIVTGLNSLYDASKSNINLTVLFYTFTKNKELSFQERRDTDSQLDSVDALLEDLGWCDPEWLVMQGLPDKAAEYMQGYGLVATAFPVNNNHRAELLSHLSNPVLLFRQ